MDCGFVLVDIRNNQPVSRLTRLNVANLAFTHAVDRERIELWTNNHTDVITHGLASVVTVRLTTGYRGKLNGSTVGT